MIHSHDLLEYQMKSTLPVSVCRLEGLGAADIQSEDDQGTDSEHDPPYWQQLVGQDVLAGLRPQEIKRQEVINGEVTAQHRP